MRRDGVLTSRAIICGRRTNRRVRSETQEPVRGVLILLRTSAGCWSSRRIASWSRSRLNTLGCHRDFVTLTSPRARHRRLLRAHRA